MEFLVDCGVEVRLLIERGKLLRVRKYGDLHALLDVVGDELPSLCTEQPEVSLLDG